MARRFRNDTDVVFARATDKKKKKRNCLRAVRPRSREHLGDALEGDDLPKSHAVKFCNIVPSRSIWDI